MSRSKRVVRRMSDSDMPIANGWTVSSSRHAWSSIPQRDSTSSENSRCRSGEKSPWRHESSTGSSIPATSRHEHVLQAGEDRCDLGRSHAPLVVVEERVVRVVERLVTRHVLLRQRDPAFEVRAEDLVVGGSARLEPGRVAERSGPGHLGAQVARHAALLLVVAACDAHDARFERVPLGAFFELAQLLEERAELGRRGTVVREPGHCRELLGPRGRAKRRHSRLLVPDKQGAGALEVGDLAEAPQELVEVGAEVRHDRGDYRRGGRFTHSGWCGARTGMV